MPRAELLQEDLVIPLDNPPVSFRSTDRTQCLGVGEDPINHDVMLFDQSRSVDLSGGGPGYKNKPESSDPIHPELRRRSG